MKVTGKSGLGEILKIFLQVCFWGGCIFLVLLPFILQSFGMHLNAAWVVIYPNGIVLLIITRKFINLFDSLKNNNPFCEENVKILKSTAIVSLVSSIFWLIDFIFEIGLAGATDIVLTITLAFLVVLFLGVSIALYILSELLKQATEYKKENDLTI